MVHICEADIGVSILFSTLLSLDLPVWVFTQGKVMEASFTWCGLVKMTIAIMCFQMGALFHWRGQGVSLFLFFFNCFLLFFLLSVAPGFNQFCS